eukprot:COSAG04_NODE_22681_length_351_cov_0.515873_1_plen_23_part_10
MSIRAVLATFNSSCSYNLTAIGT